MNRVVFIFLFVLFSEELFPQVAPNRISGFVIDKSTGRPLEGASITCRNTDDTLIRIAATSSKNGYFILDGIVSHKPGFLLISFVGYFPQKILIDTTHSTYPITIALQRSTMELPAVVVSSGRSIVVKKDTIEFDASHFLGANERSLTPVLDKIPGFLVMPDGTLNFNGERIERILIDGKEYFGGDIKMILANINPEMINKIEVIDKYSEESLLKKDFRNKSKVVNISIKDNKRDIPNGSFLGSFGNDSRYFLKSVLNKFSIRSQFAAVLSVDNVGGNIENPGGNGLDQRNLLAAVNYSSDLSSKFKLSAGYRSLSNYDKTEVDIERRYLFDDSSYYVKQERRVTNSRLTNVIDFNFEYKIDSSNNFSLKNSLSIGKSKLSSLFSNGTFDNGWSLINSSSVSNMNDGKGRAISSELIYNHLFLRKGRELTFDLALDFGGSTGYDINRANYFYYRNDTSVNTLYTEFEQKGDDSNDARKIRATVSYSEPLSKNLFFIFYGGVIGESYPSRRRLYDFDSVAKTYSVLNDSLSYNRYNHTSSVYSDFSFRYVVNNINSVIGVRYANVFISSLTNKIEVIRRTGRVLPFAYFEYNISLRKSLVLNYDTEWMLPSYEQLNPTPDNSNLALVRIGNDQLIPSYSHKFSLVYKSSQQNPYKTFNISLLSTIVTNQIIDGAWIYNGKRFIRPSNVQGNSNLALKFVNTFSNRDLNLFADLIGGIQYDRNVFVTAATESTNDVLSTSLGFKINYKRKRIFNINVTGNVNYSVVAASGDILRLWTYSSALNTELVAYGISFKSSLSYFGINQNNSSYVNGSLYLSRAFFQKKKFEVRAQAVNLFNQNDGVNRSTTPTYIEEFRSRKVGRFFLLGAAFFF